MSEFYSLLSTTPVGMPVDVKLPKNLTIDTQAPSFKFEPLRLNRRPVNLYKCNDGATLVWDRHNGAVVYNQTGDESLELGDYWNGKPNFPSNVGEQDVVLGRTLSLVQFKGRRNYAHFVLECISKLFYFTEFSKVHEFDYYLVDAFMEKAFSEIATILKLKGTPIFIKPEGSIRCENLYITSHLTHPANWIDPNLLSGYHHIVDVCKNSWPETAERIFIDRVDGARGIVNRVEVNTILERYDFKKVSFDNIEMAKQIAIVNNAKIISGIHGAAFANLIFSTQNQVKSCVEIIPQNFGMQSYWFLANGLGMEYYAIPPKGGWGQEKVPDRRFDDIDVDVENLELAIKMAIKHNEGNSQHD